MPSEKQIETRLRLKVKAAGGIALKFVSPGFNGVPDRLVFMPSGRVYLVELKAPGKRLTKLQFKVMAMFKELGFKYYIIDSYEAVEEFINDICTA